ncbi:hypothetical protein JZ751_010026, partial [Albula glossodonta]
DRQPITLDDEVTHLSNTRKHSANSSSLFPAWSSFSCLTIMTKNSSKSMVPLPEGSLISSSDTGSPEDLRITPNSSRSMKPSPFLQEKVIFNSTWCEPELMEQRPPHPHPPAPPPHPSPPALTMVPATGGNQTADRERDTHRESRDSNGQPAELQLKTYDISEEEGGQAGGCVGWGGEAGREEE